MNNPVPVARGSGWSLCLALGLLLGACSSSNSDDAAASPPAAEAPAGSAETPDSDPDVASVEPSCTGTVDRNAAILSNGFAFGPANHRRNDSAIDASNVARLRLRFAHAAQGYTWKRGAPAVTTQAIFFSSGRDLIAMNRKSGCVYWAHRIPQRYRAALVGGNAVRSAAIYLLNEPGQPALVLAGDFYGNFYAVDAVSGELRWSRFLGTEKSHHWITGGAQFHDGKLFVPVASKEVVSVALDLTLCCTSHGMLQALDPYTGESLWTYHTAPEASYQASTGKLGPNGMSIWGTPAIDAARNLVYVGTGQNLTPPITPNADAIVALDMDSGETRWVFQSSSDDAWNAACELPPLLNSACVKPAGGDFDIGAPPILVHQSNGSDAVLAGAKNGVVYSLDADNGALNWSRKLGQGGTLGGIHWGMAADDDRVYVGVSDVHVDKTSGLAVAILTSADVLPVEGATPGLYALDLLTGAVEWQIRPQHRYQDTDYDSIYSAALSLSKDVLFAGALDGELRAFDTANGKELWRYDTAQEFVDVNGVASHGGTIDSVGAVPAGDMLLVNSGYDTFGGSNEYQSGPGNGLLVFELPD